MKDLTPIQLKAIALLVARDVNNKSYQDIAEEVGVSASALYQWRHKPAFRARLNEMADEVADNYLTDAYRNIGSILSNPNAHDRDKLKASQMILKLKGKDIERIEITEPQDKMEELLARINKL